jgi:acyl-CoA thioesterase-1
VTYQRYRPGRNTFRYLLLISLVLLPLLATAQRQPVILVLGDSLSAAFGIAVQDGWVHLLQKRLETGGYPHQVVNASISGDTSAGGLSRLPAAIERHQPSILILELGANDGLRGQPISKLHENLQAMIELAQQADTKVLLVGILLPPNYGPAYTEQFQETYPQLAEQYGLGLVPFLLDGVATNPELMQGDGLHPNALAQPTIMNTIWAELEPMLQ